MPCYFHFSGQNIIKCITFYLKTQRIVINQYFLKYWRQSDCFLFRFSTSQIWTYYSNIIQILSGVSKDGENPLLKLLIRDSYLSALVSLGTVQHCRLFLSLLGDCDNGHRIWFFFWIWNLNCIQQLGAYELGLCGRAWYLTFFNHITARIKKELRFLFHNRSKTYDKIL